MQAQEKRTHPEKQDKQAKSDSVFRTLGQHSADQAGSLVDNSGEPNKTGLQFLLPFGFFETCSTLLIHD